MARPPERGRRGGSAGTALVVVLAILAAACAAPTPSPRVSSPAVLTPTPDARDVLVLRYECVSGPITAPRDRACFGPTFSLYGDGTVIFRRAPIPELPEVGGALLYPPYQRAVLTRVAAAELYTAASQVLRAVAAKPAPPADPNAPIGDPFYYDTFFVLIDGRPLTVAPGQGPVPPAHVSTPELGPLTRTLEGYFPDNADLTAPMDPWSPDRFLTSVGPGSGLPTADWPWPDLAPDDFAAPPGSTDAGGPQVLDQAHAALAGGMNSGGLSGLWVRGPDGTGAYSVSMRALMPDEPAR